MLHPHIIHITVIMYQYAIDVNGYCLPRMELRCVVAIIRHGDRTPKQKMKMVVTHEKLVMTYFLLFIFLKRFIQLFEKYDVKKKLQITLKSPGELQVWYKYHVTTTVSTDLYYVGSIRYSQ